MFDFRSDTVTLPTDLMRKAMFEAVVGDDVYGDDPSVNKLEHMAAEIMGKEAALFVPSGTMGNQIAIMTHTQMGDEIIADKESHVFKYEAGAYARLSGVSICTQVLEKGYFTENDIIKNIRADDAHFPRTSLLCLENPKTNGMTLSITQMKESYETAKAHGLRVHLDGARIFNAACYLEVDVKEIAQYCDSVMFCVSKGLCAPVGSLLCGSAEFIKRARRMRKILGGGMRQAGVIAVCGIVALETMIENIKTDHENARYLAQELSKIDHFDVNLDQIQTNMVFVDIHHPKFNEESFISHMLKNEIKVYGAINRITNTYRFVTHYGIEHSTIDLFIDRLKEYLNR